MKIFLVGFSTPMQQKIGLTLKNKGVEVLYWLGGKRHFEKFVQEQRQQMPQTIFHDIFEAILARPAPGVSTADFAPLDPAILAKMLKCESQVLAMMTRLDFTGLSLDQKRHLYYQLVEYWYGALKKFQPDAVVFGDIPHAVFNLIIYHLAKLLGIKTVLYKRANGVPNRLIFFTDFEEYGELKKVLAEINQGDFSLANLSQELQTYYQKQIDPQANFTPFRKGAYLSDKTKPTAVLPGWGAVKRNLKTLKIFKTGWAYLKMLRRKNRIFSLTETRHSGLKARVLNYKFNKYKKRLAKEYSNLVVKPNYQNKFVYVPLHLQPECSTNPMGGVFDDQILMVKILASALPPDWLIYVKENPVQWTWSRSEVGRYPGYYQELVKLDRVFLVPIETSTFELIKNCQAVATVASTAGWEALARNKPSLVFGYVWYMHCAGAFRVGNVESCRLALDQIAGGFKINSQEIIKYLAALEKESLAGYPKEKYQVESVVAAQQNIDNIAQGLYQRLIETNNNYGTN